MLKHALIAAILGGSSLVPAHADTCAPLDEAQVSALFDGWNLALASLDAERVAERYWPDAVLIPTRADAARATPATVRDYFVRFLQNRPRGRIDSRTIQVGCNTAIDAGAYTFSMMDAQGKTSEIVARYTYVYAYRKGIWKILHHNSSLLAPAGEAQQPKDDSSEPRGAATPHGWARASGAPDAVLEARSPGGTRPFLNIDASPSVEEFYPLAARAQREEGAVSMQVCALADGQLLGAPEVLQSSGSPRLDEAAQAWAQAARWIPAIRDNKRVEGCTKISIVFRLRA